MSRCRNIILGAAFVALIVGRTPVLAQTTSFRNYHCADGSEFIVGFYPYDSRAYLQIDGGPITLRRRLAFSGTRYSAGGVSLKISTAGGIAVKRPRRPETACDLIVKPN